ncbi:MAG: enoyl-CoA hydratase/isomerase family protein [Chloroflexi bacterium]|nr:enoyl-CoA hydratase/isomerase family protein [Chloroflexota bacterium]
MSGGTPPLRVQRDGPVVLLTLDRPHVLNALDGSLVEALIGAFEAVDRDAGVRVVVLRGAGRAFSAGGDLTAFLSMDDAAFSSFIDRLQELARRMRRCRVPIVGALHGYVLAGGFELAAACDLRIAADDTVFGLPDTAIGLPPTSGLSFLLPRIVGEGRARDLLLVGGRIDAGTALEYGLVSRIVPAASLEADALEIARAIADHPPDGIARIRAELRRGTDEAFEVALADEAQNEVAAFSTPDVRARLQAFADRHRSRGASSGQGATGR